MLDFINVFDRIIDHLMHVYYFDLGSSFIQLMQLLNVDLIQLDVFLIEVYFMLVLII
jgi:hypothetical protein